MTIPQIYTTRTNYIVTDSLNSKHHKLKCFSSQRSHSNFSIWWCSWMKGTYKLNYYSACSDLTTSYMSGLWSGFTDVQRTASSRAAFIPCCSVRGMLGSSICDAPSIRLIRLRTQLTMSEQSFDAGCSAGLPVISSRRMTPKL